MFLQRIAKLPLGWKLVGSFLASGMLWLVILWVVTSLATSASLLDVLSNAKAYAPPPCHSRVCVLSGPGGLVNLWVSHVDRNRALGRVFVVKGVCASACAIAAHRAEATLLPGARLVAHKVTAWN
jgi:hypothetical protein